MPLLSVIIPTKNRQETAVAAVLTAIAIDTQDMEIIVQDCSDDDSLKPRLLQMNDARIKYHYDSSVISMTDNWNKAYGNATGDYQIGIGDDDAVFKEIYSVAVWAKKNNIEAVGHTEPYLYFWPNFPAYHLKRRLLFRTFSGKMTSYQDLRQIVLKRSSLCDDGYGIDLPMVYHRLISKNTLNKLTSLTGRLLDGTSLDVYSSFALGLICKEFIMIDYPFSMRGASGKSNTGRFVKKEDKQHFDEYKHIDYPDWMPKISFVNVSIAESIYRAFVNTKNEDLVSNIDKAYLYATCLAGRPAEKDYIMGFVNKYLTDEEKLHCFRKVKELKRKNLEQKFRQSLERMDRFFPILTIYRFIIRKKMIYLDDTVAVQKFHDSYVSNQNISLGLHNP